jgi:hypothetical protein
MIHAIRPGMNPSGQIPNLLEASIMEKLNGLGAARSHFADGDDLLMNVQLIDALG